MEPYPQILDSKKIFMSRAAPCGAALLLVTALAGCLRAMPGPAEGIPPYTPWPAPPTSQAAPAAAPEAASGPIAAVDFAPISYYDQNCSRCHGAYGSAYGEIQKRDDSSLRHVVKEMSEGPGNAPLDAMPLEVEVAYHRSFIDKRPFLILTKVSGGKTEPWTLTGEATPNSEVTVKIGDNPIAAKLDGHVWTVVLPADADLAQAQVTATQGDARTTLALSQGSYSHAATTDQSAQ